MGELLRVPRGKGSKRLKAANDPIRYRLHRVKARCKMKGIEFDIKPEDLNIPSHCPLLGVRLIKYTDTKTSTGDRANLWSIDRKDPTKGYIKGNVWILSFRANQIKNDATIEEMELLLSNWKRAKLKQRSE